MKLRDYRVFEYMKTGFNHNNKMYYGLMAFVLYTFGFIKYHVKKK